MTLTPTDDLLDFLLARIAEDEVAAEECRVHDISTCPVVWHGRLGQVDGEFAGCECGWPTRVLAECEAKRRIVNSVDVLTGGAKTYLERLDHSEAEDNRYQITRDILLHLALPYAAHPDYREEWRP